MNLLVFIIPMDLIVNLVVVIITLAFIRYFAKKRAKDFKEVKKRLKSESELYTEIILGVESAGQSVCNPGLQDRQMRIAIWELYNNLRVQPNKQSKSITLQRKLLEKKEEIYHLLERGRVEIETLPFMGIIGTLVGFAISFFTNQFSFNVNGIGFFLAASSTIFALSYLINLKKTHEAETLALFDYFNEQQNSLEKIMTSYEGFRLLEDWLKRWPQLLDPEKSPATTQEISMEHFID